MKILRILLPVEVHQSKCHSSSSCSRCRPQECQCSVLAPAFQGDVRAMDLQALLVVSAHPVARVLGAPEAAQAAGAFLAVVQPRPEAQQQVMRRWVPRSRRSGGDGSGMAKASAVAKKRSCPHSKA